MRTAEKTLETLGTISKQHPDYVFHRVYRELFNRDLLLRAYLKLAPNEGNMTRGTDGKTIDGFGMALVDEIIDELRSERFYPKPARREYIPKANGKNATGSCIRGNSLGSEIPWESRMHRKLPVRFGKRGEETCI